MKVNGINVPTGTTAKEPRHLVAQLAGAQQRSVLGACSSLPAATLRQKLQPSR